MKKALEYIKKHEISYTYLSRKMNYSASYICQVLNEYKVPSYSFKHLLIFVLTEVGEEIIATDKKEREELIKELKVKII